MESKSEARQRPADRGSAAGGEALRADIERDIWAQLQDDRLDGACRDWEDGQ